MKKYKLFIGLAVALGTVTGCMKNSDVDFPDFDYQTVYFASQYPIRTIVLGEDMNFDNTLDNEHKFEIKATLGGARYNKNNVVIKFDVKESLLNGLLFANNGPEMKPLPSNYYALASDQITIGPGAIQGGVQVQLTDAFFADPQAMGNTYALPLQITDVQNVDSVLADKDFVFYAVKFINPWHGNYLRRGVDVMTGDANRTVARHAEYVEKDELNKLTTRSLTTAEFPVAFRDEQGNRFTCSLLLSFDGDGKCTITTNSSSFSASGTGAFVKKGEKNSWGKRDRDALYLDYQVAYNGITVGNAPNTRVISGSIATKDTLVMRDRGVAPEYFAPVLK